MSRNSITSIWLSINAICWSLTAAVEKSHFREIIHLISFVVRETDHVSKHPVHSTRRSSLRRASSSSRNVSLQNSKRPTLCCLCRLNDLLFTYRTSRFFCLDHNFAAWQQYTVLHKKEKSEKTENRYYCQAKKLGSKQENQLILFVNSKALSR